MHDKISLTLVAGARPNFMKIASLIHAIKSRPAEYKPVTYQLVHTGQHYDNKLSDVFFEDLQIPSPNVNLEAGSGSHAQQTGEIMTRFEEYLSKNMSSWVVVVGDVNSTLACSIVAKKLGAKVAHVEGGIRSGDLAMPEEINRLVTDSISDLFFTTSVFANANLLKEGKSESQIYLVGNTMIDSLIRNLDRLVRPQVLDAHSLEERKYFLMTLHRPSNVDDPQKLDGLLRHIIGSIGETKLIFPIHPRTRKKLAGMGFIFPPSVVATEPLRYLEFLYLVKNAKAVVTDSGGIQEETTYLQVPCLTLRSTTERPETISVGTNVLIGNDFDLLDKSLSFIQRNEWKSGKVPEYWDGKTGARIIDILARS